jgi:hypothetical protein
MLSGLPREATGIVAKEITGSDWDLKNCPKRYAPGSKLNAIQGIARSIRRT